jgi:Flp pilus assembly protein TadG
MRFAGAECGMAAVEFSLILPIMVMLWIGGVEVTQALSVDRRLNNLASSMGDLVARTKTITYAQINNIFDIADAAMYPYNDNGPLPAMRISAVTIDDSGNAKVSWSRAQGSTTAYAKNTNVNTSVPSTLRGVANKGNQVIMSEVFYTYTPTVGYLITGDLDLEDRMFFVPRLVAQIKICPTADQASCVTSI